MYYSFPPKGSSVGAPFLPRGLGGAASTFFGLFGSSGAAGGGSVPRAGGLDCFEVLAALVRAGFVGGGVVLSCPSGW